jgi:hypothetical protein
MKPTPISYFCGSLDTGFSAPSFTAPPVTGAVAVLSATVAVVSAFTAFESVV